MVTYVVLVNFTDQGIRTVKDTVKRAAAFTDVAKKFGVTTKEVFWTQGRYDIVIIVEAPDEPSAMAASLSLSALGNVRTESLRAFSAADMKAIVAEVGMNSWYVQFVREGHDGFRCNQIPGQCPGVGHSGHSNLLPNVRLRG